MDVVNKSKNGRSVQYNTPKAQQTIKVSIHRADTAQEVAQAKSAEFDIHATKNNHFIITHDRDIQIKPSNVMKTETKQDVRKVDSAKIKDLPPQFDDYLQAMKENITADKMYFLEMKGTGAYQGNKDSFPQGVRQKVIDHQLEPNATIISFHRRNIKKTLEENNSQSKAVQCGLLFRHPEGYEAGKSIGTNMPKDGTVNNLQEITESLKDEPLLLENAGLFLHDTLILQSTPQEIKEYISQIGEQKTIGLWQVATKDSDKMDKNMILAQKRLKQAGHKGNCYLITDHKDDIIRLASKDD